MKKIVLLFTLMGSLLFAESELDRAYAKEFAFLKAQKEMLQKRLDEVSAKNVLQIKAAKEEIESLQNRVLAKNRESEALSDRLFRAQQHAQELSDDTSIIEAVVMQSATTLRPYGIRIAEDKENYQNTLKTIFGEADALIVSLGKVQKTKGAFYLSDGSEQNGELIKIGNVATFGIAGDVAGALAPAGDGKLKLWNAPEAAETAMAMGNGEIPESLKIFVYENVAKEVADKQEKSMGDTINEGGLIGWVIVGLGGLGTLLILLRILFLSRASSSTQNIASDALKELLGGGVESALAYLKAKKGATSRVIKATIRNLDRDREHVEDIVSESILHESGRMDRFSSAIMVIAAVSPRLGLLGTVTGMIATFDIITEFGTGDPKLLSGGISEALVTTMLGLIVAIPMLLVGNLLSGWSERIKDNMEHSALHLINEYNKQK
jgi:biopolymer transport protein ExbB